MLLFALVFLNAPSLRVSEALCWVFVQNDWEHVAKKEVQLSQSGVCLVAGAHDLQLWPSRTNIPPAFCNIPRPYGYRMCSLLNVFFFSTNDSRFSLFFPCFLRPSLSTDSISTGKCQKISPSPHTQEPSVSPLTSINSHSLLCLNIDIVLMPVYKWLFRQAFPILRMWFTPNWYSPANLTVMLVSNWISTPDI